MPVKYANRQPKRICKRKGQPVNNERRNDVGNKILVATISALIGIIMTVTWVTARDALARTNDNRVEIAALKECVASLTKVSERLIHKIDELIKNQ